MGKTINVLLISFVPLELEGAGTSRLLNLLVDFLSKKSNIKLEVCTLASTEEHRRFGTWEYNAFKSLPINS